MQNIANVKQLKQAIRQLESDKKKQSELLKEQFEFTANSLKPKNLVVSMMKDLLQSPIGLLIGAETIRSLGHRIIDRFFRTILKARFRD